MLKNNLKSQILSPFLYSLIAFTASTIKTTNTDKANLKEIDKNNKYVCFWYSNSPFHTRSLNRFEFL